MDGVARFLVDLQQIVDEILQKGVPVRLMKDGQIPTLLRMCWEPNPSIANEPCSQMILAALAFLPWPPASIAIQVIKWILSRLQTDAS